MKRYLRNIRNRIAARFFQTRYGRNLLIQTIGPRVLLMTVDCGDHTISFSPADYIGRSIFAKGHFDRDHVGRLLEIMKSRGMPTDGKVMLELGGNIGTHTVYFALTGAFAHIVSVEPDPRNYPLLLRNIAENSIGEQVTPVNCAAGDHEGQIDFFMHPSNHGKSSPLSSSAGDVKITVPVKPVSRILQEAGVQPGDIGLVWMDIEGYEPVAFSSMHELMALKVPIYTEYTPEFYGPEQTAKLIDTLSRYYEDCLVFFEDVATPMKVRDIPIGKQQFDILLLP